MRSFSANSNVKTTYRIWRRCKSEIGFPGLLNFTTIGLRCSQTQKTDFHFLISCIFSANLYSTPHRVCCLLIDTSFNLGAFVGLSSPNIFPRSLENPNLSTKWEKVGVTSPQVLHYGLPNDQGLPLWPDLHS